MPTKKKTAAKSAPETTTKPAPETVTKAAAAEPPVQVVPTSGAIHYKGASYAPGCEPFAMDAADLPRFGKMVARAD